MQTDLKAQFRYDAWANREVLDSLRQLPAVPQKALALLGHILAAQQLWLDRVMRMPQTMPVWPEIDIPALSALNDRLERGWQEYIDDQTRLAADSPVDYTNSRGESFSSRPSEIVTHVLLHGAYHRGQIASNLRQAGVAPPYTDFIHAVRTGAIRV